MPQCCLGNIVISLILWAFAGHAYRVNAQREADDPERKDFHPLSVYLVPFTWPFIVILYVLIFVIRALLYGLFLIIFTILLVLFRDPVKVTWFERFATRIGNKLLQANSFLADALFPRWGSESL